MTARRLAMDEIPALTNEDVQAAKTLDDECEGCGYLFDECTCYPGHDRSATDNAPLKMGRDHLTTTGEFRSDKYTWCKTGFVPLKVTDHTAWPMLRAYADVRRAVDPQFADDLHAALDIAGAPR